MTEACDDGTREPHLLATITRFHSRHVVAAQRAQHVILSDCLGFLVAELLHNLATGNLKFLRPRQSKILSSVLCGHTMTAVHVSKSNFCHTTPRESTIDHFDSLASAHISRALQQCQFHVISQDMSSATISHVNSHRLTAELSASIGHCPNCKTHRNKLRRGPQVAGTFIRWASRQILLCGLLSSPAPTAMSVS